jgi:hypothetical protein
MKHLSPRTRVRSVLALATMALALFAAAAPQATAKRAPLVNGKRAASSTMRSVDLKQEVPGPAFADQWEGLTQQIASKRVADRAPLFGDSDVFVRFSAMTGSPRLVFADLGEAPAANTMGDRAMAFLQQNAHVFGIETANLALAREVGNPAEPMHIFYDQKYQGLPVFTGSVAVHMSNGHVFALNNTYVPVNVRSIVPSVSTEQALDAAAAACGASRASLTMDHMPAPELGIWPTADGGRLAYLTVVDARGVGVYEVIVDAATGEAIEAPLSRECFATGTGQVFQPSPTVTLANDALRDNQVVPEGAYVDVTLPYLDDAGNMALVGTYAQVPPDQVGGRVTRAGANFSDLRRSTTPSTAQFNQENVYWGITFAQDVFQSAGYTVANGNAVMNFSLQAYGHQAPHFTTDDNSHFVADNRSGTGTGHLCFGTGGVDDAEDQEIVWHEFGHAMLWNQKPGTNQNITSEGVGEGTGDVLAGILSMLVPGGSSYHVTVGEWDATSYNASGSPHPFLRKLDIATLHANRPSAVHSAGQVWSHPVFDFANQVGPRAALRVMLRAQFLYDTSPTQVECAAAFLKADSILGGDAAGVIPGPMSGQINNAFRERGTIAGTVVPVVHTVGSGVQATGTFFLRNSATGGDADTTVNFGPGGAFLQIVGDWNGNGSDTIGLYDPTTGFFFLKNTNTPGNADLVFSFGPGGANFTPVVGDWDGNGSETIGIYDNTTGFFFLRNSNTSGPADLLFSFGPGAGFVPVVGDWDANGTDTVGIYGAASGFFFLKNSNAGGSADLTFGFGPTGLGAMPIAGNWDATAGDTVGVYLPAFGLYFLKNTNASGNADYTVNFGGANSTPLAGDWNGVMHTAAP